MPDEALISEIENLLAEVVELGGQNERSQIVPNLTVQDANPTNLDGFVIVSDDRDGDNILAKKVGSVIYADNDLVNLMFLKGGEAIAFQQGSESSNSGIWEIAADTSTDIYYNKGRVGIGTNEPFQNVAAGTADYTGEGLHVEAAVGVGRYIVEGTSAEINMIDGGGAADDKILTFVVDGGIGKYVSYNDDLTVRTDNILTVDMGDGNIGIRTATPDMPLQVGNGTDTLGFTDTNNTVFAGPDTSAGRLILEGTVQADIVLIDGGAAANDKAMQLLTVAGQTEFRALSDVAGVQTDNILVLDHGTGNVGIDTNDPQNKLSIGDSGASAILNFQREDDTISSGNHIGNIYFGGTGSWGDEFSSAIIRGRATDTWASGDTPSELLFFTTPDGSGNATQRVTIADDGNVGVNGVTSPSTELDVGAGAIEFEEMTAPAAGAANTARLFAQDNGAGKTQLAVRFNTGAIQILATEP